MNKKFTNTQNSKEPFGDNVPVKIESHKIYFSGAYFTAYADLILRDDPIIKSIYHSIPDSVDISIFPRHGDAISFVIPLENILNCNFDKIKNSIYNGGGTLLFGNTSVTRLICGSTEYGKMLIMLYARTHSSSKIEFKVCLDEYEPFAEPVYITVMSLDDLEGFFEQIIRMYEKYKKVAK